MNILILLPLYNQVSFKEKLQLVILYIKNITQDSKIDSKELKIIVLTPLQADLDIDYNVTQKVIIESDYIDTQNMRSVCKKHQISKVLFFPDCDISLELIDKNLDWLKKNRISLLNHYHRDIVYIKSTSKAKNIGEINNYIRKKWHPDTDITQEQMINYEKKYKSFLLLDKNNFHLIGVVEIDNDEKKGDRVVECSNETRNAIYNILNFVGELINIHHWVITVEFIADKELFYVTKISLKYNSDLITSALQFGFNISNLLSYIFTGNNIEISKIANNQIAQIPYYYNHNNSNLILHTQDHASNVITTLNNSCHDNNYDSILINKVNDLISTMSSIKNEETFNVAQKVSNKLLIVFFEYLDLSDLLSLNQIIDYIKNKHDIDVLVITKKETMPFIVGIKDVFQILSINLNISNIKMLYDELGSIYNKNNLFTLIMQSFFAKEWVELIDTLHSQFIGISSESIKLLYSEKSNYNKDREMIVRHKTHPNFIDASGLEKFEVYLFVDNNVNLVGIYQSFGCGNEKDGNYVFNTTSILHSKRYIYDQIVNKANEIIAIYNGIGLYKILFIYSHGELYWQSTEHSFNISFARILGRPDGDYSLMLDIFINCICSNTKISQNSDIRYTEMIYKYNSIIYHSEYYMINESIYNNIAKSNIVVHHNTTLKAVNTMWKYMKYNNMDCHSGKKCIIINANMQNIKHIPALYRNIKLSNYYDKIYITNRDVINHLNQRYSINDIVHISERNIDKIQEVPKLVISLDCNEWLDEYVYKKYLLIARNYYEALFYIDAMIVSALSVKDRKTLL